VQVVLLHYQMLGMIVMGEIGLSQSITQHCQRHGYCILQIWGMMCNLHRVGRWNYVHVLRAHNSRDAETGSASSAWRMFATHET